MEQNIVDLRNQAADISIYTKMGKLFQDKSGVAVEKTTNKILAIGEDAFNLYEQHNSSEVELLLPFACGYVSHYVAAEKMLRYFLQKNNLCKGILRKKMAVIVPKGYDEIQKKAMEDMTYQAGASQVYVEEMLLPDMSMPTDRYNKLLENYDVIIVIGKENPKLYVHEMSKWFINYANDIGVGKEELLDIIKSDGEI